MTAKTFSTIGEPIFETNHLEIRNKRSSAGFTENAYSKSSNRFNSKLLVNTESDRSKPNRQQQQVERRDYSSDNLNNRPRVRLLEPPKIYESELERVFKVGFDCFLNSIAKRHLRIYFKYFIETSLTYVRLLNIAHNASILL